MNKTATFIKMIPSPYEVSWTQDRLYRLSEPLVAEKYDYEKEAWVPAGEYRYVTVSASMGARSGPETHIFGCDENGESLDYDQLPGSSWGHLSHDRALEEAGYSVRYEWAKELTTIWTPYPTTI